jgi:hypothetical protein
MQVYTVFTYKNHFVEIHGDGPCTIDIDVEKNTPKTWDQIPIYRTVTEAKKAAKNLINVVR